MTLSTRSLLALLLALAFVIGGAACSAGNKSKLSQSDVNKLNNAIEALSNVEVESGKALIRCKAATNEVKCLSSQRTKVLAEIRSAATEYEAVAGRAHGECQAALRQVSRDMRSMLSALTDDSKTMATAEKLAARVAGSDTDAVLNDCKLKLKK